MRLCLFTLLLAAGLCTADENTIQTIRDLYASSRAEARNARTKADLDRALSTFAPEWVGNMPAGETFTRDDLVKEAESVLAVPPEKRPMMPEMHFVYIRETGWNVLAVYWNYRRTGNQIVGALCRDTWVRTADGWKRIRTDKLFPDRPLIEDGKPMILPSPQ